MSSGLIDIVSTIPSPIGSGSSVQVRLGRVTDCHQHLWPASFVELLRGRTRGPRLEGWTLHLDGEPPYEVDPAAHDLSARRATDADDGIDLALLSLSSPLGIEAIDPDESAPLLAAWHSLADDLERDGVDGYGVWAAVNVVEPDLDELATWLRHPRVHGLQVRPREFAQAQGTGGAARELPQPHPEPVGAVRQALEQPFALELADDAMRCGGREAGALGDLGEREERHGRLECAEHAEVLMEDGFSVGCAGHGSPHRAGADGGRHPHRTPTGFR